MRRSLAAVAATLATLSFATACGDEEKPPADSTDAKVIELTFEGGTVTPNGDRVEVAVGQDIELDVTADEPGEIHVHSTPEQELEYAAGESTVTIKGIDQPGVVEVESHELDQVIVQLEVR